MSNVESVKTLISAAGERRQQLGEDAGEREVERALDLEGGERPLAARDFFGTLRAAQTIEVSVAVAVIENSEDDSAQSGTSAPGPSRTTARVSG